MLTHNRLQQTLPCLPQQGSLRHLARQRPAQCVPCMRRNAPTSTSSRRMTAKPAYSAVRCSVEAEIVPSMPASKSAGNALGKLYVALLPGALTTLMVFSHLLSGGTNKVRSVRPKKKLTKKVLRTVIPLLEALPRRHKLVNMETFNLALSLLYTCTGPLKYSPSLLFPISAMLSTFGAVYGHHWVLLGLSLVPQQARNSIPDVNMHGNRLAAAF